ncbi:helicase HerA domain-containing protein [Paenibacillus bovis]|uniref:TraG P-loop domain-containing protein n=1 Tax=Paenibacillus bovis TaxID=1616788 RepID=A0A1X9T4E1_9BACL|nr:DUF87 domain-containing protein [Paenibacillus bovis]ARR10729.1 hypothetical protein AR543_p0121 [Paenibacillus bovis]
MNKIQLKWRWKKKNEEEQQEHETPLQPPDEDPPLHAAKRLLKYWKKRKFHLQINPDTIEKKGRLQVAVNGKQSTTGHFVRVLMIKDYPPSILVGYLDHLEEMIEGKGVTLSKKIRYAESTLKWNNSMKNQLKRLDRNINEQSPTDPARKAELLAKETIESIRDATLHNNKKLVEVTTFLTLSAAKEYQLDDAESMLKNWFDEMDGKLDNLRREQAEAMRQVSPVYDKNTKRSKFFNKRHYGRVLTDDVAAGTYPLTRGSFSDTEGPYFGRRTEDGSFCFINICDPNDPRAQNLTVFGKTGSGKSFFLKALVVSLLQENIFVYVFDLDGEWRELCEAVGGIYIDQTASTGNYFDPMVIMPKLPGLDKAIEGYNRQRYSNALDMTLRTFSMLAGELERFHIFEIGEAIEAIYTKAGIERQRPDTWNPGYLDESTRPTIHKVFQVLKERAKDEQNEGREHAYYVYDRVKIYFEGIYRYIFSKEESLEHIIGAKATAPLVVYKVGEGIIDSDNEKQKSEKSQQAHLKMSMAFDIVNSSIARNKVEGVRFSAVLVDEGQRQTKNRMLRDAIFSWYTAIRKLNGLMILASNTPAIMLDYSDGVGMWENTNVRVYFYMETSAVRSLAQHSTIPQEIQEGIEASEDTQTYFLEYHKRYDQLWMDVPEEEAELYKTRGLNQEAS